MTRAGETIECRTFLWSTSIWCCCILLNPAPVFPTLLQSVWQTFSSTVYLAGLGAACLTVLTSLTYSSIQVCHFLSCRNLCCMSDFFPLSLCKGTLLSWKCQRSAVSCQPTVGTCFELCSKKTAKKMSVSVKENVFFWLKLTFLPSFIGLLKLLLKNVIVSFVRCCFGWTDAAE